jgi:uncharacterized membrane protein required for colicin V production
MPPLDLAITILIGVFAVLGFARGFVRGVLDLALLAAAVAVAARFYPAAARVLADGGVAAGLAPSIGFVVLLFAVLVLGGIALRFALAPVRAIPWPPPLPFLNRLLGLGPGAVKGAVAAVVVLAPLSAWQSELGLTRSFAESRLAPALVATVNRGVGGVIDGFGLRLSDFSIPLGPAPAGRALPFSVTDGLVVDRAAETEMLDLVNAERERAGLAPLAADERLATVARSHADEMFRLGYFAHESPISGEVADRLDAAGLSWLVTGENLALAQDVGEAHQGLMESPGHRANILNPAFTRVGIGVIRSPANGVMVTQVFAG